MSIKALFCAVCVLTG